MLMIAWVEMAVGFATGYLQEVNQKYVDVLQINGRCLLNLLAFCFDDADHHAMLQFCQQWCLPMMPPVEECHAHLLEPSAREILDKNPL